MSRTLVASEDFTSFTNWTNVRPFNGNISVSGGVAVQTNAASTDSGSARWTGAGSFTADQYAKAVVGGMSYTNSNNVAGVILRASSDTDSNRDYYLVIVQDDNSSGSAHTVQIHKIVNGTITQLSTTTQTYSNGDTIEAEAEGTTIRAYRNGSIISALTVTDASLSSGNPGIILGGGSLTLDNWEGGNLTAGGSVLIWSSSVMNGGMSSPVGGMRN